ncbi:MAG TPA: glycosyltransferase [Vicinamibacteria bacterium]
MRILLVQPSLQPPGGGNAVGAWMLEALKDQHELTALTWRPPDPAAMDRFFGTNLLRSTIRWQVLDGAFRWGLDHSPLGLAFLKDEVLLRRARAIAGAYDLLVTANNESDLGGGGIQYVHYPRFDPERPEVDLRWYNRSRPLMAAYRRASAAATGASLERMRRNVTLVNSDWVGARIRRLHSVETITLRPPVAGSFPDVPWEARADGFCCVGRIAPEKRIERVLDVLAEVRRRGRDVRLHVIGAPDDLAYTRRVRERVARHADWATLHEDLPREALVRLLAANRYGLHAMEEEHFGMAVAEMARAGCIPFVPRGGGQVEIVGGDERFLYASAGEAVAKILATLDDPAEQRAMRAHLAARVPDFAVENFMERIRAVVEGFMRLPSERGALPRCAHAAAPGSRRDAN